MRLAVSQRIYRLDRVIAPRPVHGFLRACDPNSAADFAVTARWFEAFNRDVGEDEALPDPARVLGRPGQGLFFWEHQRPVSMAGFSGATRNGIRIGRVYTPPELRRQGYASACVAALSQRLLDEGRKFCFLYTDLANPTSNRIYQEIGYRPVCDAVVVKFENP